MDRRVVLGRVSGLYGVRGWVKLHSFTRPPDNLLGYRELTLGAGPEGVRVCLEEGRRHGKTLIARFAGIDDRDAAAALVGQELSVDRASLPDTGGDEYYWADLIGLEVRNREGVVLGQVENLLGTGANDVLVIRGDRERLVPFVQGQYVLEVDLAGGQITVDWDPEF
jgi:16S rRNA processing protein RimM